MGDRGNIIVQDDYQEDTQVYLYSHWGGSELPKVLAHGLDRGRERWSDSQYLTRILFCQMLVEEAGENTLAALSKALTTTTGMGISATPGDGGTDLVVNTKTQTVSHEGKAYTFDAFIESFK